MFKSRARYIGALTKLQGNIKEFMENCGTLEDMKSKRKSYDEVWHKFVSTHEQYLECLELLCYEEELLKPRVSYDEQMSRKLTFDNVIESWIEKSKLQSKEKKEKLALAQLKTKQLLKEQELKRKMIELQYEKEFMEARREENRAAVSLDVYKEAEVEDKCCNVDNRDTLSMELESSAIQGTELCYSNEEPYRSDEKANVVVQSITFECTAVLVRVPSEQLPASGNVSCGEKTNNKQVSKEFQSTHQIEYRILDPVKVTSSDGFLGQGSTKPPWSQPTGHLPHGTIVPRQGSGEQIAQVLRQVVSAPKVEYMRFDGNPMKQNSVGIVADIEAMFHQVLVNPKDRDSLRSLWWPNEDLTKEMKEYRMVRNLFCVTSSPSVANFYLRKTAQSYQEEFYKEVIETANRNMYVDDMMKSTSTTRKAISLASQLRTLLEKGGFRMMKWYSNDREVMATIPESERAKSVANLELERLPTESALGLKWNIEEDKFVKEVMEVLRRLSKIIQEELDMTIDRVSYWSDSTSVLNCINNESKRFHTSESNRQTLIRNGSKPSEWRYVSRDDNPADDGSKGLKIDTMLNDDRCLKGPRFLWEDKSHWPNTIKVPVLGDDDEEVRKKAQIYVSTAQKLRIAEREIFKRVQQVAFPEVIDVLSATECCEDKRYPKKVLKKAGASIRQLSPQTKEGLLRVGGRLVNAPFGDERRHPIILPYKHHVTDLIIKQFHENLFCRPRERRLGL
ncbi:hypothetical protein AWC38_SpisGene14757 [Stylophora pistillata]|uniref:Uncharacterized protein n=1 Tax=Stylophora pistillata TaxID=50429 RepID=A0A2B4RX11_STYPI|nr:hypothetical protein AWC38_SpisGene14757 [Stylophora pistillata]